MLCDGRSCVFRFFYASVAYLASFMTNSTTISYIANDYRTSCLQALYDVSLPLTNSAADSILNWIIGVHVWSTRGTQAYL